MNDERQPAPYGMNVISPAEPSSQFSPELLRSPARRLTWRTFVIPLVFLLIHFFFSGFIAVAYAFIYTLVVTIQSGGGTDSFFNNLEAIQSLLESHYSVIAALLSVAVIPICLIYLKLNSRRDARTWMTARPRVSDILAGFAMMAGSMGFINVYFNILMTVSEQSPFIRTLIEDYEKTAGSFNANQGYFWLILGVSVLTPIMEELIFRGVIQGELSKAMPAWAAIVIQAVIFAAYHMQPIQSSYVILPGLLLGLAYYWSRSIWVPIAMHCIFNFLGSALPMMLGESETAANILGYSELGFILVGILAAVFMYLSRRSEPERSAGGRQADAA